jgi:twitching motility protein PilT
MSYIEKLLDSLLKYNGDKLVISLATPPYVFKDNQKNFVTKKELTESEFQLIEFEFNEVFSGAETFSYKHRDFASTKSENYREFELIRKGETEFNLENLLQLMVQRKASDLHLSSECRPILRIDGDIQTLEEFAILNEEKLWPDLQKITPDRNRKEFENSNDTDFAHEVEQLARFRVNIFRDHRGIGAVLRRIPSTIIPPTELGIPPAVVELCNFPKGLILVTGPTGSGKSTTLAALIDHINRTQKKHVITIEDPVEFVHWNHLSLINQREVNTHTESFKKALRAALREDPDVILVGEMRDLETIAIAIEMAATGHLVFGTLHTATAIGTVDRIIDQFPAGEQEQIRTMLADALLGVVSQILCKKKESGRVAAYEVLMTNAAVSNIIREGKTFQLATLMQTGKAQGNRLMNDSLLDLVEGGSVAAEEALSKSIDKDSLKNRLKLKRLIESE